MYLACFYLESRFGDGQLYGRFLPAENARLLLKQL